MMTTKHALTRASLLAAWLLLLPTAGCQWARQHYASSGPAPLGSLSDPVWQNHERNAEMADFVVHEHEFVEKAEWLTTAGEDHVKQIAARVLSGQEAQVVVQRSMSSARSNTKHHYPIHPNPELDERRREIIVRSLLAMGVTDADERTLVAPDFAQGLTGNEAEATYYRGLSSGQDISGVGGAGGFGGFMFRGGF